MYTQTGNYAAAAGLVVVLLAKFGVISDVDSIVAIFGGVGAFIGIVKQFIDHKKLAVATGTPLK